MTAFTFQKDLQLWGWHEASVFAPAPGDSQSGSLSQNCVPRCQSGLLGPSLLLLTNGMAVGPPVHEEHPFPTVGACHLKPSETLQYPDTHGVSEKDR